MTAEIYSKGLMIKTKPKTRRTEAKIKNEQYST